MGKAEQLRRPHECARAPLVVAAGGLFVFIAYTLASSSLRTLRNGELTVDVERSKERRKLAVQGKKLEKEGGKRTDRLNEIKEKMEKLAPVSWFKVTCGKRDPVRARKG